MKPQRGFTLVELAIYAAIALAVLGAIAGVIHVWNNYTDGLDQKGYTRGVQETRATYETRDANALRTALADLERLQAAARTNEATHARKLAAIGQQLEKEKARAENQAAGIAADLAAGRLVRRDDAFEGGGCPAVDRAGPAGPPRAGAGGGDGAAPCKLSGATEGRVFSIGKDADAVARQLAACQAVIIEDRRLCGTPPDSQTKD